MAKVRIMPEKTAQEIDVTFTAEVIPDSNSGWPCVNMPDSAEFT